MFRIIKVMRYQLKNVEPLLFGYMFCLFLTFPVEQQLIYRKICLQNFNKTYCHTLYKSRNSSYEDDQNFIQGQNCSVGNIP